MKPTIAKLESLMKEVGVYLIDSSDRSLETKPAPNKWSKKEILGHLIDSAINNLKRFTEAQFLPSPYRLQKYRQDDLVRVNAYQRVDVQEILTLWLALNRQIAHVVEGMKTEHLDKSVILDDGSMTDLRFLVVDYVEHMEHHVKQIVGR